MCVHELTQPGYAARIALHQLVTVAKCAQEIHGSTAGVYT